MSEEEKKKKEETNDVYENISNSLETTFEGEEVPKEIAEVAEQADVVNELVTVNDDDTPRMVDGAYIRKEIKNLVDNIEVAMTKVQQNILIGSQPRHAEVFSQLANSKTNVIKELISMNKAELDARMKKDEPKVPKNLTQNFNLSSSELLKLVNGAKKKNSLKNIEAKFDIQNEKNLE